jgi:hypothetical protein
VDRPLHNCSRNEAVIQPEQGAIIQYGARIRASASAGQRDHLGKKLEPCPLRRRAGRRPRPSTNYPPACPSTAICYDVSRAG